DATEDSKTLAGAERIAMHLLAAKATKRTMLIVIGGGITQDISSFAAHCWHRGMPWTFVPTTLLAMADSCIGAKTAINLGGHKNQLGFFQSPTVVHIATDFTRTLEAGDIASGWGEILKLSLTHPAPFVREVMAAVARDGFRTPELPALIRASLAAKQRVIEIDEYEHDLRRILNYGHTFGHALEGLSRFAVPHGTAVAWGLDCANTIAVRRGLLAPKVAEELRAFVAAHFRVALDLWPTADALVAAARRDKKSSGGSIAMALLHAPGDIRVVPIAIDVRLTGDVQAHLDATARRAP
ncbi:MAG TPA: 3-dehydroquinate synthase family protein, partial [Gemmatimonadaceae bacterium]